jgi:hypothetical protein
MGLKSERVAGLFFLGTGVTIDLRQLEGVLPEERDKLTIYATGLASSKEQCLNTQ